MDKNKATTLIEETFDKAFDKQKFILFARNLLNDMDIINNEYNVDDVTFQEYISHYTHIGNYTDPDGEIVDILQIEVFEESILDKARTSLRNFAVDHLERFRHNYALVAYNSKSDRGNKWRFSFVKVENRISVKDGKIKQEKDYSPAKRYSFLVGKDRYNRTAKERLLPILSNDHDNPTIKQIEDAFSVEILTKQFYTELFDWYLWALNEDTSVSYPEGKKEEHIIRLITRLMFVWFLKQKKSNGNSLVPYEIFDIEKLNEILVDFDPNSRYSGNYYNAILQNLFFATLNRQIVDESGKKRAFADKSNNENSTKDDYYSIKTLFRDDNVKSWFKISHNEVIDLLSKVPFLNGGLFECLDKVDETRLYKPMLYFDGFSRDNQNKHGKTVRAFVPNHLFFAEKENVKLKKYEYNNSKKQWVDRQKEVSGLIIILKRYNFTIEENTPSDIDVALDPELLGKVFENLLGAFNPETEESARKQSGSFYTPREIVNYMTVESLTAYLKNKVGENWQKQKEETKKALFECKILDPACGSGAFPMGILNKIIDILRTVEPEINIYETKLNLIENCIYGVDIQPIAVQIAKLRFFISLICEQTPNNDPDDNYGIVPLPNLESKFVVADTLIPLNTEQKGRLNLDDPKLQKMKNDLWNIRNHKNLRASSWQEKKKIRKEDNELCKIIEYYLLTNSSKPDLKKIEQNNLLIKQFEKQITELPEDWIDTDSKQSSLFGYDHQNKLFQIDRNKAKRDDLLMRIQQCRKEIEKEERKATFTGLEAEIHKMVGWNPYDQNSVSPFFDSEWMFGLMQGFDIVIGNPPYVNVENLNENLRVFLLNNYKTCKGRTDIYVAFIEKLLTLLNNNGNLSFIIPFAYTNQNYGSLSRKLLIDKYFIREILDTSNYYVFENAVVKNIILQVQNTNNQQNTTIKRANSDNNFKQNSFQTTIINQVIFLDLRDYRFETKDISNALKIKKQIESNTIRFDEICLVAYGARLNHKTKKNGKENYISLEYKDGYKLFLEGKNIERYGFSQFGWLNYQPTEHYNSMFPELFENEKIIFINVVSDRLRFAFDNKHFYNSHTVINCVKWHLLEKVEHITVKRNLTKDKIIASLCYDYRFLLAVLNSKLINWYFFIFLSEGLHFYPDDAKQLPIAISSFTLQQPIISLVDYILFLKRAQNDSIIPIYYENIIDACVYELYFPEEIHTANKGVIEHLQDLKLISDNMADEQKLAIINSEFERLYDPYHPVRNNVETIENVEIVRIIKESLRK
ncbi:MAG: Eco57I restriction-modification methylase domain-containing protein [Tannerellaceae bacterium]|jgi:methylase of polypeptide subunit release factors|nr:Eco57I restriction-modification methylase domain-containing protein [Tannerellaceae bacterium]